MIRSATGALLVAVALSTAGCQSPSSASSTDTFDKAVDSTSSPNPIAADASSDGRTYRVVRGNNQPDDVLAYDWHTVFSTTLTFNSKATSNDVNVTFPIKLMSTSLAVKQASGGVVTPPTGGDPEKYEFLVLNTSTNQVSGVGGAITARLEAWYDLPSLRKEAVIEITYSFQDADGVTYKKVADYNVAP